MDRPALLLPKPASAWLTAELERRFTIHTSPAPGIRAMVAGGSVVLDAALLAQLPALEILAINGVGCNGVDLAAAQARGVRVTLTPDVLNDDVAELAIGLMLAVQRRIVAADAVVRGGGWALPLSRRASGKRVGIFGMGAIGQAIARRTAAFDCPIGYVARTAKADLPWRFFADIGALADWSEVLILIAPATATTRHIVNAAVLDRLGPDGVLINVARGSLVDEAALIVALEAGRIRGAGLDVFADEPRVPDALKRSDRVVLTPHIGSATEEARRAMAELVLANLDAHFAGGPLAIPIL